MQSHRPSSAERFLSAWIRLENDLTSRYRDATSTSRADTTSVLRWAERTHLLSPGAVDFALHCRDARNAYAHVCFDGYDGPVTNPPSEVTQRLERLAATLRDPVHATSLAAVATTCEASCALVGGSGRRGWGCTARPAHERRRLGRRPADRASRAQDPAEGHDGLACTGSARARTEYA
jgi:hypothetical protein